MDVGRWLRFAAGGIANTAASYAAYLGLVQFIPYLWAYTAAYILGIVVAYVINSVLVFRVPLSLARFAAYPVIYVVQYGVAAGLLAVCVELLGLGVAIAPLAVIVAMIPVSYGLNRIVLARARGSAPQDS